MSEAQDKKPKLVGINHVALEVGDLDAALDFYGRIFDFKLRGRLPGQAFIDLGDQFLALAEVADLATGGPTGRHFGLVVDDRKAARARAEAAGATILPGAFLDFLDPWNNRVEIVEYSSIQFTKAAAVLAQLGVDPGKSEEAERQLRENGFTAR